MWLQTRPKHSGYGFNRNTLWAVLDQTGCPRKCVKILQLFHDGMTDQVLAAGNAAKPFEISNGVRQGCVLAPDLFNIFFACLVARADLDLENLDGPLFDLLRLTAKTKSLFDLIQEALFSDDDCALVIYEDSDLQFRLNRFSQSSKLFGLTISLGKIEVL